MRSLPFLLFLLFSPAFALPQHPQTSLQFDPNPYPHKPKLTFHPDGTFKLTVFSDLHFGENPDSWGPEQDANSTRLMRAVLADEHPDYAVLNGDLVTGENTFRENATLLIDHIIAPLNEFRVPFSSSHGNHDNQLNITHSEEIAREQLVAPLSYTRIAVPNLGGEAGPGNYWVPIYACTEDAAPILILWFFDSRGGRSIGPNSHDIPDFVHPGVAAWIAAETAAMSAQWGAPESRGALAFTHIPPHAVQAMQDTLNPEQNEGLNDDVLGRGSVQDSLDENTVGPRDAPFWTALTTHIKNLHALISGHNHGNEWCARERSRDTMFCFSKHSGYGGYGQPGWGFGVRNVVFGSPDPAAGVETWIRLEDGQTRARVVLDGGYDR